jgi:hypothetical protein
MTGVAPTDRRQLGQLKLTSRPGGPNYLGIGRDALSAAMLRRRFEAWTALLLADWSHGP